MADLFCSSRIRQLSSMTLLEHQNGRPWLVSSVGVSVPCLYLRRFGSIVADIIFWGHLGRKLKCDGLRPSCGNCDKRKFACSYTPVAG